MNYSLRKLNIIMSYDFPIRPIFPFEPSFLHGQNLPLNALTYEENSRLDTLIRPGYPIVLHNPMGKELSTPHLFYLNIQGLIQRFQSFLPSNIQIEDVSLIGSGMIQVMTDDYRRGKKKLKDLDLCIRISKPDDPYLVKNLFLSALSEEAGFSRCNGINGLKTHTSYKNGSFQCLVKKDTSPFEYGFLKDLCVKQNLILISLPTVTRGTELFHVDFSIVWEPETSCIGSANCHPVVSAACPTRSSCGR